MVIKLANGRIQMNSPHLQHILTTIKEHIVVFEKLTFTHIYMELNMEVSKISKLALALPPKLTKVEEK